MTNNKKYNDIKSALDSGHLQLSDKEQGFIKGLWDEWLSKKKQISWPQQKWLITIWARIK